MTPNVPKTPPKTDNSVEKKTKFDQNVIREIDEFQNSFPMRNSRLSQAAMVSASIEAK